MVQCLSQEESGAEGGIHWRLEREWCSACVYSRGRGMVSQREGYDSLQRILRTTPISATFAQFTSALPGSAKNRTIILSSHLKQLFQRRGLGRHAPSVTVFAARIKHPAFSLH